MALPSYPLVNGRRFDFASIEANLAGKPFIGIKEISYDADNTKGDVYGSSVKKLGRTGGVFKPTASISIFKEEFDDFANLLLALGTQQGNPNAGIMQVSFPIIVMYQALPAPLQTDKLVGCTIDKISNSHSQGGDALVVKCDLNLVDILLNGKPLVGGLK